MGWMEGEHMTRWSMDLWDSERDLSDAVMVGTGHHARAQAQSTYGMDRGPRCRAQTLGAHGVPARFSDHTKYTTWGRGVGGAGRRRLCMCRDRDGAHVGDLSTFLSISP